MEDDFFYCKQLSFDELIMNVSIDYENDDKTNYVIILLPPIFSFVVWVHINITPLGPAQSVRVSQSLREVPELKRSQLIAGKKIQGRTLGLRRGRYVQV